MAWSDQPTEAQLNLIFHWFQWNMTNNEASAATNYLKDHATRKEVSNEIQRLKELKDKRKLSEEKCFDSTIWKDYRNE